MDATFIWKLAKLGRVGSSHLRYDDDWVDRLNYQITCFLHFLFIGILGLRSYIGKPIQCWAPQEFNKAWEEYSENFCWVSNTFFATIDSTFPLRIDKSSKMIGYYQWTPIVLACQALLFYLPCLMWRLLMRYSGFNVRRIIQMASDTNSLVPDINTKNIRFIARYIDTCIERNYYGHVRRNQISVDTTKHHNSNNHSNAGSNASSHSSSQNNNKNRFSHSKKSIFCKCCPDICYAIRHHLFKHDSVIDSPIKSAKTPTSSKATGAAINPNYRKYKMNSNNKGNKSRSRCYLNNGRFLFFLYGLMKVMYICNIILQLYLMKRFLGTDSSFFGFTVLKDLINGHEWIRSGNFPRVTFCEVQTKKLGENNIYNLQCVLPLNMFLEKIYIFLWFYYVVLGFVTFASLLSWFARMGRLRSRFRFIRKYLRVLNAIRETDNTASLKFTENHLRPDGVFLLHLITINVGHIVAGDLSVELWNIYRYKSWHDSDNVRFLDLDPHPHHHRQSTAGRPPRVTSPTFSTAGAGAGSLPPPPPLTMTSPQMTPGNPSSMPPSATPSVMGTYQPSSRFSSKFDSIPNINNNNNNNNEKSNNHDDIV